MVSVLFSYTVFASALAFALATHDLGHDHVHDSDNAEGPTLPGKCPSFTPIASLDINKLNGDWFIVYDLKKGMDEEDGHIDKCQKETMTVGSDGMIESQFSYISDGELIKERFISRPLVGQTARFSVETVPKAEDDLEMALTILDMDNTGYMTVAFCMADAEEHGYVILVYSRSKNLSSAELEKAKAALKKSSISGSLTAIEQSC